MIHILHEGFPLCGNRLKSLPENAVLLGEGVLTWGRSERVSDRYGFVYLIGEGGNSMTENHVRIPLKGALRISGEGRLLCEIIATRESTHIGDLFHGVFPATPEVGELILLGEGTASRDRTEEGDDTIGLVPEDGRAYFWLDIRALYDCHEQSVKLWFVPRKAAS